jgi:hypothetical protein
LERLAHGAGVKTYLKETTNVADKHPEITAEMQREIEKFKATVKEGS